MGLEISMLWCLLLLNEFWVYVAPWILSLFFSYCFLKANDEPLWGLWITLNDLPWIVDYDERLFCSYASIACFSVVLWWYFSEDFRLEPMFAPLSILCQVGQTLWGFLQVLGLRFDAFQAGLGLWAFLSWSFRPLFGFRQFKANAGMRFRQFECF